MPLYDGVLMHLIAELDEETFIHCQRVRSLALSLGEQAGLSPAELQCLRLGAFLHDIGKKFLPKGILEKREPLTSKEWEIIKLHPVLGYDCARLIGCGEEVSRIILEHHLWADGQGGYPQDLVGSQPCFLAQITTVADVFDAMTSRRPYRAALSASTCLAYLEAYAGTKFNPDVVHLLKGQVRSKLAAIR